MNAVLQQKLLFAHDIDLDDITSTRYDLCLYAAADAPRSRSVADEIKPQTAREILVTRNGIDSDLEIYNALNRAEAASAADPLTILIDYSSLAPPDYAAVFNWAGLHATHAVSIDFVYAESDYDQEHPPLMIDHILTVPGCEGGASLERSTVALFGLGYDGPVALGVLDRLEPDWVYAIIADPGSTLDAKSRAEAKNKTFLDNHADLRVNLPISHVASTVQYMHEIIAPHIERDNIVLVPLGPKPHALAAQILSRLYPKEIACLYVRGERKGRVTAKPTGRYVKTRVLYGDGSLN